MWKAKTVVYCFCCIHLDVVNCSLKIARSTIDTMLAYYFVSCTSNEPSNLSYSKAMSWTSFF